MKHKEHLLTFYRLIINAEKWSVYFSALFFYFMPVLKSCVECSVKLFNIKGGPGAQPPEVTAVLLMIRYLDI